MNKASVVQSHMTYQQARTTIDAWVAVRAKARAALIARARSLHPENRHLAFTGTDYQHEVRKLWRYPSDLSEARLLRLIDHPRNWRNDPPAINGAMGRLTALGPQGRARS